MHQKESDYYIAGKRFRPREATCERCGRQFIMRGGHHKFCSEECALRNRNGVRTCPVCGTQFAPAKPTIRFCSRQCYLTSIRDENASPNLRN